MNNQPDSKRQLSKGIYISGQPPHRKLELDIPELLEHLGIEDTEANRDMLVELGQQACEQAGLVCDTTVIAHSHKHNCPGNHDHAYAWLHSGKRKDCKLPRNSHCPAHSS